MVLWGLNIIYIFLLPAPTLQFERMAYSVREPGGQDETIFIDIRVMRTGDQNRTSSVRCSTRDGSAKSGVDYEPYSKVLRFDPGKMLILSSY